MLLRGTPLFDRKEKFGLVESDEPVSPSIDRQQKGIHHVVSSPGFTYSDWRKMVDISESLNQYNEDNQGRWKSGISKYGLFANTKKETPTPQANCIRSSPSHLRKQ